MKEPLAAKPRLLHRRTIVGAMFLVLALALAGFVFGVFDGKSTKMMTVTFVGFEPWVDGKSTTAVVRVKNISNQPLEFMAQDNGQTIVGGILSDNAESHYYSFMGGRSKLEPSCVVTSKVPLLMDGTVLRIKIQASRERRRVPRFLSFARKLWYRIQTPEYELVSEESDQLIQCPQLLQDGTVEPARVVTKEPR